MISRRATEVSILQLLLFLGFKTRVADVKLSLRFTMKADHAVNHQFSGLVTETIAPTNFTVTKDVSFSPNVVTSCSPSICYYSEKNRS